MRRISEKVDATQAGATSKGMESDISYAARNLYINQSRAVKKRICGNVSHGIGNRDIGQADARIERAINDTCDA